MIPTPPPADEPTPAPGRCPECGCGWWEPHRTDCSQPRFPTPDPVEGRPGADCARRSHWIGSNVGKTDPGYGHDGGYTSTPCVPYEVAADCDPLALCTVTPPAPPPAPTDGEP